MIKALTSNIGRIFMTLFATEENISCFHCNEKSRKSLTIYVNFDGNMRPVCCHGCAAVLKTVEELAMHQEYYDCRIDIHQHAD